ncbi:hypothetical protein [Microlunatus speluncae]|uniref:hypothetical protein n=1 Tax=Microlunatus speluncae TaxID=2594267 RepID=UPI0012660734|nr:hypothetical protein [Microlunatus speluncae]
MSGKLLLRWLKYTGLSLAGLALLVTVIFLITGLDPRSIPPHRYVIPVAGLILFCLMAAAMSPPRRNPADGESTSRLFNPRIVALMVVLIVIIAALLVVLL